MTAVSESPVSLPGALDTELGRLAAALDKACLALWQIPDRELSGGTVACGRLVSRTQALLTRMLGEVDDRDLALRAGACSTTAWTRHELNVTPQEAKTLVGVATAVRGGMAATSEAFAAGELGLS